jgi:L-rhamnose isomerase
LAVHLRKLLKKSFDEIFPVKYRPEGFPKQLFGIGSESMVVGSHDFYLGYAVTNNTMITLDNGHFHPTEQTGDKISSILLFIDELLLHLTRGVRWDSDHVLTFNDELLLIAQEIVRAKALNRVNIGLDFFDASLNRIGAYVIGTRSAQMAFLYALLEPLKTLVKFEEEGKNFERLSYLELMKSRPFGAVWDYYCMMNKVPVGWNILKRSNENMVLSKRL